MFVTWSCSPLILVVVIVLTFSRASHAWIRSFPGLLVPKSSVPSSSSNDSSVRTSPTNSDIVCENGVCRKRDDMKWRGGATSNDEGVSELQKLGWSEDDAKIALRMKNNDILEAANFLEFEQEQITELIALGWNDEISKIAVRECDGNVTAAREFLEKEENEIVASFEKSVHEMMENGWDELVARQALLAQHHINRAKSTGENTTISRAVLDKIRPSFKKPPPSDSVSKKSQDSPQATSSSASKAPEPKPAKKEDVVFEVTAANFQKVVLNSDVPVLLDIYADWCGPCRQLGPMLEEAAVRAGGLFRLAKLNSDREKSVVDCLQVSGLPTVYAVTKGKLTDRFVGMIQPKQIQDFLIRAVTGSGERLSAKDVGDADLELMTSRLWNLAGLASITSAKKGKLFALVEECLGMEEAFVVKSDGSVQVDEGVKTALAYIENCRKDILNEKFRAISIRSKAFQSAVEKSTSGRKLLEIAGFRFNATSEKFELVHNNAAILSLIQQRATQAINDRKFRRPPANSQVVSQPVRTNVKNPATSAQPLQQSNGDIKVHIRRSSGSTISSDATKSYPRQSLLRQIIRDQLKLEQFEEEFRVELRLGGVGRVLTEESVELDQKLSELAEDGGIGLSIQNLRTNRQDQNSHENRSDKHKKRRSKEVQSPSEKRGLSKESHRPNEYFGGDSTVVQSEEYDED